MGRFVSAGTSDVGNVRGNNEDRVYLDPERGIYLVVDGMGGEAAGEEAAEIAVKTVRGRLERQTETAEQRVREAIALANNAIYDAASANPEWRGMACVLTVALVEDGHAVVGHVGDSRAYQIRAGRIEKLTRDHSPVGEREDAGELSEEDAMRHPRRNEVYRDVGSRPRTPDDEDFIDVKRIAVPRDSALLLCSDGLSDVVPSRRILQVVEENASDCEAAVKLLVRAAVTEGKDNVSVVLVEGENFAAGSRQPSFAITKPPDSAPHNGDNPRPDAASASLAGKATFFALGILASAAAVLAFLALRPTAAVPPRAPRVLHVALSGGEYLSVPEAMNAAVRGDTLELAPGKYPDKILLRDGISIRAEPPRQAEINGIVADSVTGASVSNLLVGSAGIELRNSSVHLEGLESTGHVLFNGSSTGSLHGCKLAGVAVADTASPDIAVNYIEGGLEWTSSATPKLDGNGIRGPVVLPLPAAPGIRERNLFPSAAKPARARPEAK